MAALAWWAVKSPVQRTGRQVITYVQASSRQQAAQTLPGSTVLGGPYKTLAEAEKAFPGGKSGTTPPPKGEPPPTVSNAPIPGPLDAFGQVAAAIRAFWDAVTNGPMWRCIGWIILGLVLAFMGIRLWLGKPVLPKVIPVPV